MNGLKKPPPRRELRHEEGRERRGACRSYHRAVPHRCHREPILATVSAEDGSFSLTGIPYGKHVVREIAAPEGYVMDETPYTVKVDQNGAVVEICNQQQAHSRQRLADQGG